MNNRFKFRFFNEYSNKLESCDEYKSWNITTISDNYWDEISSPDDLPITVTRNSLRQFILEILKEKGLLQEQTNEK